jgi:multisubunit Na+/H+ antiporter MnhB subunit
MADNTNELELRDRLELIENMLAAGRRKTENWGWVFVLWGVAYYTAIAWATWGSPMLAWPVTMSVAVIVTGIVASRKRSREPETTIGRAIGSIWTALGISMFLLFMAMGFTHRVESNVFVAIICAMLGMANATSGLILKWKMQLVCAAVWWSAAVATCFANHNQTATIFLAAIFFCQIVFGIYALVRGSRHPRGAVHA